MSASRTAPAGRCSLVVVVATAAYATGAAWLLPAVAAVAGDGLDDLITGAAAATGLLAGTWLWLGTVATAVAAAAPRTQRDPAAGVDRVALPAPVRRLVLLACGLAVTGSLTIGPGEATPGQPHLGPAAAGPAAPVARDGVPASSSAPQATTVHEVVVAPGDSLWVIAERTLSPALGPAPSDADVARRWHRIYADNRGVIGPDPDLVQPAQRLRVPAH